jgi:hypothetical protein
MKWQGEHGVCSGDRLGQDLVRRSIDEISRPAAAGVRKPLEREIDRVCRTLWFSVGSCALTFRAHRAKYGRFGCRVSQTFTLGLRLRRPRQCRRRRERGWRFRRQDRALHRPPARVILLQPTARPLFAADYFVESNGKFDLKPVEAGRHPRRSSRRRSLLRTSPDPRRESPTRCPSLSAVWALSRSSRGSASLSVPSSARTSSGPIRAC